MVQIRKPGNKRNINSGVVSHDAEVRVLLDNGDSNLVRYAINIPNIIMHHLGRKTKCANGGKKRMIKRFARELK